jgi:hypothetical protein
MEIITDILQKKTIDMNVILTMFISLYGITVMMFLFKSIPSKIASMITYHFTTTVLISSMDECYYALIKLLEQNGIVCRARKLRFINGHYGCSSNIDTSIGPGTHYLIYKKKLLKVSYKFEENQYSSDKVHIELSKLGRSHKLFNELKNELQSFIKNDDDTTTLRIYSFTKDSNWRLETKVRKRDFSTIFIEENIKNRLLNHLDNFYSKEDWYHERGIPYQTGLCLHGPAGTGKTSIVKGLASHYNKSLCILRPNDLGHLPQALRKLPNDSFIVIEDIDTSSIVLERNQNESIEDALYRKTMSGKNSSQEGILTGPAADEDGPPLENLNADEDGPLESIDSTKNKNKNDKKIDSALYTRVYLSDVLNALDGLISIEKRVIIFTTNHLDKLDKALIRPGRIDCIERIEHISFNQFKKFCTLFYKDTPGIENPDTLFSAYNHLKYYITIAELQKQFMQGMKLEVMINKYCKYC